MGDTFKNISGSVIATRGGAATRSGDAASISESQLSDALQRVGGVHGAQIEQALREIARHLERQGSLRADGTFRSFCISAAKPEADTSALKALWSEFKEVAPHASSIASALKTILTMFS